jgi:hypothetical protein
MNTATMRAYIESRSIPEPNTGCWLWMLSLGSHNYPQGFNGTKVGLAHRFSYEAFVGAIPETYEVDHKCKNRSCVLFLIMNQFHSSNAQIKFESNKVVVTV